MPGAEIKSSLAQFAAFARALKGDEKSEAQIFLDHFFRALGHAGVQEACATLMLAKELELIEARKLADTDQLLIEENPLPLDNLDTNIVCADALFAPWPEADAIIGNPPYLGSRYLAKEHGYDYANKIYARFPGVPKMADFCTHWFRLAHDALAAGGRAGLVGLHVSIVNWEKASGEIPGSAPVSRAGEGVPPSRTSHTLPNAETSSESDAVKSSFRRDAETSTRDARATRIHRILIQRGDKVDSTWKTFELPRINTALSPATDVTGAQVLAASAQAKKCYTGQNPVSAGFFLTLNLALAAKEKSGEAITPPGLPLPDAERAAFTTTDCIRA